jgi:hypothetical protein
MKVYLTEIITADSLTLQFNRNNYSSSFSESIHFYNLLPDMHTLIGEKQFHQSNNNNSNTKLNGIRKCNNNKYY